MQNKQTEEEEEILLTVHDVAQQLRVDDTTVRRWINEGLLEGIRLPGSRRRRVYRVPKSVIDAMLSGQ